MVKLKLNFHSEGYMARLVLQEHRNLLRIFLLNDRKHLNTEAEILLMQHAVHRGLSSQLVALSKWLEFGALQRSLNFEVVDNLAIELCGFVTSNSFSSTEIKLFWNATKKILYHGLSLIRNIRKFPMDEENISKELQAILR